MNFRKNSKGITLIALVITIIVLLILAGVALSLVMGNDGIIGRAESAVNETDIVRAQEQVKLLASAHVTDYYNKKYAGNGPDVNGKSAGEYVAEKLTVGETAGDYNVTATGDKIKVTKNGTPITEGTIRDDGSIEWYSTLFSQINETNYGEYVNLETSYVKGNALDISATKTETATEDWRIFHKDTNGTWLILADYLPYSFETGATAGSNTGLGTELVNAGSSYPYNWRSTTSRSDLLTKLGNSTAWNKLLSSEYTSKGIRVTGAIDIETFKESFNKKSNTEMFLAKSSAMSGGLEGYYVKGGSNDNITSSYYYNFNSSTAYLETSLYYPHKRHLRNNNGYWLASPSAESKSFVMNEAWDGHVSRASYVSDYWGVRPAVYLPSDIPASKDGNVWKVEK